MNLTDEEKCAIYGRVPESDEHELALCAYTGAFALQCVRRYASAPTKVKRWERLAHVCYERGKTLAAQLGIEIEDPLDETKT